MVEHRLIAALERGPRARVRRSVRSALSAAFATVLAGCATTSPSPLPPSQSPLATHQNKMAGEIILTRGLLVREGSCVVMDGGFGRMVPIWPTGTMISDEGVVVPTAGRGTLLRFGEVAYLHGVHVPDLAGNPPTPAAPAPGACGKQAFVVQRAQTHRAMQAASPNPPSSGGMLIRRGKCLVFDTAHEGVLLPIWPEGTVVTEETVTTPDLRGHPPLVVGSQASVEGRYVYADDGSLQRAAGAEAAKCARTGMIVEKARRVYIAGDAAEKVAMSDAVLIVELVELNPSDPLQDGFLTTMVARVVEPLTGRFRVGEMLKLRHGAGRDPVRGWQATPHDPLFEAMGPPKVKPGDRLLLFVIQDLYRQSAEHHGSGPVPGYIGVGGGIYRLENDRLIDDAYLPTLKSLDEVRQEARKTGANAPRPIGTTSASATRVTIAGCCSFTAPAGAAVTTPPGVVTDGFPGYTVQLAGETVTVEPLLGSYGWLGAQGGATTPIQGRPAREMRTRNGTTTVIPLRAQINGREALMSLQLRSNCGSGSCALHRAIVRSVEIEARWMPQFKA